MMIFFAYFQFQRIRISSFFLLTAHEEANVFLVFRICHGYLYIFFHYTYVYFLYMCAYAGRYKEKEKNVAFLRIQKITLRRPVGYGRKI